MIENKYCVYRHIRLDTNEVFYIGYGISKRPYEKGFNRRSKWWNKIVAKTEYKIEILSTNLTLKEAHILEIKMIAFYGRKNLNQGPLINLTDGGDGALGLKHSKETKLKQSLSAKGRKWSKEERKKLSDSHIGYICTKEQKDKISKALKGIVRSENMKQKVSKAQSLRTGLDRPQSITLLDINTGVFYYSYKEYCELHNLSRNTCCRQVRKGLLNIIEV